MQLQGKEFKPFFCTYKDKSLSSVLFNKKAFFIKLGGGVVLANDDLSEILNSEIVCLNFPDPENLDYEKKTNEILSELQYITEALPVVVQISVFFPPDLAVKILAHKNCQALATRTCLYWNQLPENAQQVFFRRKNSPFKTEQGGFVFGKYIKPLALEWLRQVKRAASSNPEISHKPIIAGGGIMKTKDIKDFFEARASAVIFDQASLLRFWNLKKMENFAQKIFS